MNISRRTLLALTAAACGRPALAKWQLEPEAVLHNGVIWTGLPATPEVQALAIAGDRILAIGTNEEMLALAGARTRRIDLERRRVTPGFNDAHSHPIYSGIFLLHEVALEMTSIEEIVAALRARAQDTPPGQWVRGFLYDDGKTPRPLSRADLDRVSTSHPVRVYHRGGHTMFVNSLALQLAGVTRDTPDPQHGAYFRDANGELDGRIADAATSRFEELSKVTPTPEDFRRSAALVSRMFTARGITSACDAAGPVEALQGAMDALEAGELRMRCYIHVESKDLDRMIRASVRTGFGNEWVRLGAVKFFADGSISERTAWLSQPYIGMGDYRGLQTVSREEFHDQALKAHKLGWQIGTHANGDLGIALALDVYEQLQKEAPRRDPRFRLEHCTLVNPDLVRRIKALGAIPVPFAGYVRFHADVLHFYGDERLRSMFAMRDLLDAGIPAASSSDYTASPPDPMLWLQSQVTRKDDNGHLWGPNQRISVAEALVCGTANGAYASFEEHLKGRLQPGLLADLVVWDQDMFAVDPDALGSIKALRTMTGGRWVHEA